MTWLSAEMKTTAGESTCCCSSCRCRRCAKLTRTAVVALSGVVDVEGRAPLLLRIEFHLVGTLQLGERRHLGGDVDGATDAAAPGPPCTLAGPLTMSTESTL